MPDLLDPAALDPQDVHPADLNLLTCARYTEEVSGLSPPYSPAIHNLIAFCDEVFKRNLQIGEGGAEHHQRLVVALPCGRRPEGRHVVDEVGGEQFLLSHDVPLTPHVFDVASSKLLVLV